MSNTNIANMNDKQLRNEVQLLRDELAIFKRKYEDLLYNLDDDNFSSRFIKEKGKMKTAIEINAEGIKTKVSNEEFESTKTQLADTITSEVKKLDETLSSRITQRSNEIYAEVNALDSAVSSVSVKANVISSRVTNLESFKTSTFTQTEYGFTLDGEQTTFTGVIYLTDNSSNKRFSFFHDESQGFEQVFFNSYAGSLPIIIGGATDKVYLNNRSDYHLIATQGWVLENAGSGGTGGVARFG